MQPPFSVRLIQNAMSGDDDSSRLFWLLLNQGGSLEDVKGALPAAFSWRELEPVGKRTILVTAIASSVTQGCRAESLNVIEWLVESGASWSQKCSKTDQFLTFSDTEVDYSHSSAVSFIEECLENLAGELEDWQYVVKFLKAALLRIASGNRKRGAASCRARVSIDEGIVEIWEKIFAAHGSHDLTIQTADHSVTAHAAVLSEASPVVKAMMASTMKEGASRCIAVTDMSSSAVTLLLEVLYTCSTHREPSHQTVLSAMDLAHRWQILAVVNILSDLVEGMLDDKSFTAIAESAALKGPEKLRRACQSFGAESATVQSHLKQGKLPDVVSKLFKMEKQEVRSSKRRRL